MADSKETWQVKVKTVREYRSSHAQTRLFSSKESDWKEISAEEVNRSLLAGKISQAGIENSETKSTPTLKSDTSSLPGGDWPDFV